MSYRTLAIFFGKQHRSYAPRTRFDPRPLARVDVVSAATKSGKEKFYWYENSGAPATDDDDDTNWGFTPHTIAAQYPTNVVFVDDDDFIEVVAVNIYVAKVDGDTKLDVLYADDTNGVLAWNAQGDLDSDPTDWGSSLLIDFDASNKAKWVMAADFDGDGDMDVVAAKTDGTIPMYENSLAQELVRDVDRENAPGQRACGR